MVAVITPTSNGFANYFTYINGALYTAEANFYFPQAVSRQNAWLGRSGWMDLNISAEVDTFNVYNVALSDTQVTVLATAALGSSSSATVPSTCSAQLTCPHLQRRHRARGLVQTSPSPPTRVPAATAWEQTDAGDAGCPFVHQGIATFSGSSQYADLTASSGVNSVGSNTLPATPIGGAGSGSLTDGTMGWSFEFTFRSGTEAVNGKIFAIGAGEAVWNIFAGPDGTAVGATFGVYDGADSYGNGHSGIVEIINPISTTTWYHVVAVVQQISTNATHGAWFLYVNGQPFSYASISGGI